MKSLAKLILSLAIVVVLLSSFMLIANAETEGIYTYEISNGEAIITDCITSASGAITIPECLGGYRVTSIGDSAFQNCTGLTSVTIQNGVAKIERSAFYSCTGLTNITIPDSVISIGDSAFYNTAWYKNKPDGVVYAGKVLYKYKGTMPKNSSIEILDGTIGIGDNAFSSCSGLTSITIPNSVTSISKYAFYNCGGLTSITIPDSVISIGENAFIYCSGLTSITIPVGVTSIGDYAFSYCSGLTSITIPVSVTSTGDFAFSHCSGLTSITIPVGVTSIGDYAFSYCSGLTSITIPVGLTSIGDYAFSYCSGLTSITIPVGVTSIGGYAFSDCNNLTNVNTPDNTKFEKYAFYNCSPYLTLTIRKNSGIIPEGFCENNQVVKVVIESGITEIGDKAFYNCSSLNTIAIPSTVEKVGYQAFNGTGWLTNHPAEFIIIGKGILIKWNANKESVEIPVKVISIGPGAFENCNLLKSIDIPNGINTIGSYAFNGCNKLQSITIPRNVVSIGEYALFNCAYLTISGYENSAAENYANENYISFISLGNDPITNTTVERIENKLVFNISTNMHITDKSIHIALYNNENILVDYMILPVTKLTNEFYLVFKNNPDVSYAKVFVWDTIVNVQPIAEAENVIIQ